MERHEDELLKQLNINLMKMAALTEEAIHKSVDALRRQDKKIAQEVINNDQLVDELENTIQEEAIELLALTQPMASNLRFVTTGMWINSELERIADLTVNICQRALEIADMPALKPLQDIPRLGEIAKKMVKGSIDAFVTHDELKAKDVILNDKEANQLRTILMQELVHNYMVKDGSTAPRAVALLLVTRDLERICDHATNIAEDVIFLIRAKLIKHHLEDLKDIHP